MGKGGTQHMLDHGAGIDRVAITGELVAAARTLAGLGMVTAFGHVSARSRDAMLITPAIDLALVIADRMVTVPLEVDTLPPGTPAEAWVHLAIYRSRPDVHAIVRALPEACFAVGAVTSHLRPMHGQGAMLGQRIPVHDDARLMRSPAIADPVARTLGDDDAVVIRGNGAVTTASTPGHAVARMWLLERTCRLHLDTAQHPDVRALTTQEIAGWHAAAPPLLERLWIHLRDHHDRLNLDGAGRRRDPHR